MLGKTSRRTIYSVDSPRIRAASIYSRLTMLSAALLATRAIPGAKIEAIAIIPLMYPAPNTPIINIAQIKPGNEINISFTLMIMLSNNLP
ncbi:hypothetical protein ES705_37300 [subsurface metagenome]